MATTDSAQDLGVCLSPTAGACLETTLAACYRVDQSRRDWLRGVVETLSWLEQGWGISGCTYSVDAAQRIVLDECVHDRCSEALLSRQYNLGLLEWADRTQDVAVASALPGFLDAADARIAREQGVSERWFIHGRNIDRHDVVIVINLARRGPPQARMQQLMRRIAPHLAAGARFQRHLDPDRALGAGARAGGRFAKTPVKSKWSPIESFVSNGQRYLLVSEKPYEQNGDPQSLSAREREILSFAASGRSNKQIAYELGVADSTIRVLLARAAKKLGAGNRRDAVQRFMRG